MDSVLTGKAIELSFSTQNIRTTTISLTDFYRLILDADEAIFVTRILAIQGNPLNRNIISQREWFADLFGFSICLLDRILN